MGKNEQIHQTGEVLVSGYAKTRYSDEELGKFKDIILVKLEKAKTDLEFLNEENSVSSNNLAFQKEKFIKNLEKALIRIEQKNYGIDKDGKLIPKERLLACPCAMDSIQNKNMEISGRTSFHCATSVFGKEKLGRS
jgi:RNA polymerase-binding transcription factor DksA